MISVILPIYNKEKELKQCIKSIIKQTYTNLEIILVNDGSTDSSREICEKFLNYDNRIKLINKENQGVELARLDGLNYARGTYITFVDPDDWLPTNAMELLINAIKREDADISFGNFYRVLDRYGFIKRSKKSNIYNNIVIEKDEFMKNYYDSFCGWGEFPINMWAKLYKKALIDSVDYKIVGISHGEDLCFNLQVLPHANKIVSIPEIVYFYRWGGMTNKINKNLFKDACSTYNFKLKILKKYNSKESYAKASVELCNFFITYIDTYLKFSSLNNFEILDFIQNEVQNQDLQKAVNIPTYDWFLNNKTYQCIKEQNVQEFLNIQKKGLIRKKIKCKAMIIISKILT